MSRLFKAAALAATVMIGVPMAADQDAMAQSRTGVAVADLRGAAARSAAFTNARTQIGTTYKAQIDARNARAQALEAEIAPLAQRYQAELQRTPRNQQALQAAATALQNRQRTAQEEVTRLGAQIDLALAYVEDQIALRLNDAVRQAMTKRKVDLLIQPEAVYRVEPYVDITDAVTAEINALVPSAQIVPPAGYQPGALQQARQQQTTPTAPATQPQTR